MQEPIFNIIKDSVNVALHLKKVDVGNVIVTASMLVLIPGLIDAHT